MAPVAVLASLGRLGGALPPTYVVGCQPADVGEGIGLTPAVQAAVGPAVALVHGCSPSGWTAPHRVARPHHRPPHQGGTAMRTVGIVTTGLLGLLGLLGVLVGVRSVPDVKRYLRMRAM